MMDLDRALVTVTEGFGVGGFVREEWRGDEMAREEGREMSRDYGMAEKEVGKRSADYSFWLVMWGVVCRKQSLDVGTGGERRWLLGRGMADGMGIAT